MLFVDVETQSLISLKDFGSWVYSRHPRTRVLMWAVARASEDPRITRRLPIHPDETYVSWGRFDQEIAEQREDAHGLKWIDARKIALFLGLPAKLQDCAEAFRLGGKDSRGQLLLNRYATPFCRGAPLVWPEGDDLQAMKEYNQQDVRVLRDVWNVIKGALPDWEKHQRENDETVERMNDRGVPVDRRSCRIAMDLLDEASPSLVAECQNLCGLNPTQTQKLASWLGLPNLKRETVEAALPKLTGKKQRVAEIRLEVNKASITKLLSLWRMSVLDGRIHGAFTGGGAATGRLTSQKPQLHNFKRSSAPEGYFEALHRGKVDDLYAQTAQASRGFLRAEEGHCFIGSDYKSIEARILAWEAGEMRLVRAFRQDAPVYQMFAGRLYKRRWQTIEKGTSEYQAGKMGVLAGGYGVGGVGLQGQAGSYGLPHLVDDEEGCWDIVRIYRATFPIIVRFWANLEAGFRRAMRGESSRVGPLRFEPRGKFVLLQLPSGRPLWFMSPREQSVIRFGKARSELRYYGRQKNGKIGIQNLYGGKLAAYATQGIAADIMLHGARNLEAAGFEPILSVHDELASQIRLEENTQETLERYDAAMIDLPPWAHGIPIATEGWIGKERYGKY